MNIAQITYPVFSRRVAWVIHQLENPKGCEELLAAARKDMPILDALIAAMNALALAPGGQHQNPLYQKARRDLEVFLTLWHLIHQPDPEPEEKEAAFPRYRPSVPIIGVY